MKNSFWDSEANRFTLYGALFGLLFPIIATLIEALQIGELSLATMLTVQTTDPLLWIIDSAPLFLGLFARFAGWRQDQLKQIIRENIVQPEGIQGGFEDSSQFANVLTFLAAILIGIVLFSVVLWLQFLITTNVENSTLADTDVPISVEQVNSESTDAGNEPTIVTLEADSLAPTVVASTVVASTVVTSTNVPDISTEQLPAEQVSTDIPIATSVATSSNTSQNDVPLTAAESNPTAPSDSPAVPSDSPAVPGDSPAVIVQTFRLGLFVRPELDCRFATSVASAIWQESFDLQVQIEEFASIEELIAAIADASHPRHIDATLCYIDPTDRTYLRQYPGSLQVIGDGFLADSDLRLLALRSTVQPPIDEETVACIEAYLRNQEFDATSLVGLEIENWLVENRDVARRWLGCMR